MTVLVSKQGKWDVVTGGQSDTPELIVPNVVEGAVLQVTVEFEANTGSAGGYRYAMQSPQINDAMSAAEREISGVDGWQNVSMTSFWRHAPGNGRAEDVIFHMDFSAYNFTEHGQIGQFLMFASIASVV